MWRMRSVRLCNGRGAVTAARLSARGIGLRRRRGVVILESLTVLLVLVLGLLAVIQWSIVMMTHAGVTAAATEGARTAARAVFVTSRQADTEQAVASVLAAHGVVGSVTVLITDLGSTVRVTLTVPVASTRIPNLLSSFYFSLAGRNLRVSATATET
ncbi:MAG: TadE/TadG family type IV pilus assembly protein [Planctomyces sp.]|jgi:Flp pilus assembly protein TadG